MKKKTKQKPTAITIKTQITANGSFQLEKLKKMQNMHSQYAYSASFALFINTGHYPAGNYMFRVNSRNIRTRCKICSKLTIKIPERCHWHRSGIFIVNFEHISHLVIVFLLLTLSRLMLAGYCLSSTQNLLHEKTKYSLRKVTCFLKFFLKGEHFLCSDYFI